MPKLTLRIFGRASNKEVKVFYFDEKNSKQLSQDLLSFLRQQKVPIASSCYGEGVCQKCRFNQNQLACQTFIKDLFTQKTETTIEIDYL